MAKHSLGLVTLPEKTIEYDLTVLQRFQEFSAELLRIALLGISVIGFALSRVLLPEGEKAVPPLTTSIKCLLILALLALGVSAASALAHRYFAVDSVSWHLQAMRRYERGLVSDIEKAASEAGARLWRFRLSQWAIRISATSLALGAAFLVGAIIAAI